MALTNFAALTSEEKTLWALDLWRHARNYSFINKFLGKDANSLVQHVDELTKSVKGARAVITLLADLEGDGVAGDRTLEGNEDAMTTADIVINVDQLRNASRHEGRMADQRSVVAFRENCRNNLGYWLADRMDQLAFLTLSGVAYTKKNNGATRTGSDFENLEFAADVSAPTSKRVAQWDATNGLVIGGASTSIVAADTPTWQLFVDAKAYAKDQYMRGVMEDGEETYHAFLTPQAMAALKMDNDYMLNVRHAVDRGAKNNLFTGNSVKIDGIYLHEFRHVFNTAGASAPNKYGASGDVDGCQILFCGAQALAMADIGVPEWVEKGFDYENSQGISVAKMFGFRKPKFASQYAGGTTEDFGVLSIYVAQ